MESTPKFWRVIRLGGAWVWALGSALAAAELPNPRYTGGMPIQEWTAEDIGGVTQCFSIAQSPLTGLIYVGSGQGVLEYDGVRWRRLPLLNEKPGQAVRGLTVDGAGRVWAGLDNEVLRYTPETPGQWQVESMLAHLPAADRMVGVTWQLETLGGAVWGVASDRVLRFEGEGGPVRSWPTSGQWFMLGTMEEAIWFRRLDGALLCGRGTEIAPAPLPALPKGAMASAVYRSPTGALRVDHSLGVAELRDNAWHAIAPELEQLLKGESVTSRARRLADGRSVFSTRSRALIFVSADGRVLGRFDEPPGITFGVTPQTFVDRDGGLWMANAAGIRRVQVDGIVAAHDRGQGLRGNVRHLAQDGPTLLAATAQGLFSRDALTGKFEFRTPNLADVFQLQPGPKGGWLLAAGASFAEWDGRERLKLPGAPRSGTAVTVDPADPARVFVGWLNRVMIFRRGDEAWSTEKTLSTPGLSPHSLAVDETGALWLAGGGQPGLARAAAPGGDWSKAVVEPQIVPGLGPDIVWRVGRIDGELVAYGAKGIFRVEAGSGRLVADERFAGLPEGAGTPVVKISAGAKSRAVYLAGMERHNGRYWRGTRSDRKQAWQFTELPMEETRGQIGPTALLESADGNTLWVGGLQFSVSLDLTAPPPPPFPVPAAQWRGVRALEGGEVVYGGATKREELALSAGLRAVAVEFAAPVYRVHLGARTGVEYRTRAAGVDHDWSAWSKTAARELTNLPKGRVRLEAQARNHLGVAGPVAALVLHVPPFWWETWWWRTLVVLAGAGLVAAAVRWLVQRQFRQRIALLEAQAAVQNERLRIARDMHDDLGSTLASIVHLSASAGTGGVAAKPGATLARIHEATRDLVQRTRDIVWAATPEHDSLESLVEQLAAHAERTLGDRGVAVRTELPVQVPDEAVGAAARQDLFLAFKEAVNNAAKYAQARTATVRVELAATEIVVTLTDDGGGFAPGEKKGSGNGLGNLRSRMAAIGGSAEIASVAGRGTTVTLRLPRGRKG